MYRVNVMGVGVGEARIKINTAPARAGILTLPIPVPTGAYSTTFRVDSSFPETKIQIMYA